MNSQTKVCIICPDHGEFWQIPSNHLNGQKCRKCKYEMMSEKFSMKTDEFISKARTIHGEKYDYSKSDLDNSDEKGRVCIICPIHGEFWQRPAYHLMGGGCKKCGVNSAHLKQKYDNNKFIFLAKKIHGDKYIYTKTDMNNRDEKGRVCIICSKHGEFWQRPEDHLKGSGCKFCHYEELINIRRLDVDKFIEKSINVHGDKYIYDKKTINYISSTIEVPIICPKHGEFWQTPAHHLGGCGCPFCRDSKLEKYTSNLLKNKSIQFIEKVNKKYFVWLDRQHLDFYLPKYNIAIECQGEQHFVGWNHKDESLKHIQSLDNKKKQLCEEHNIKLYYINYDENVETKLNEILAESCQSL